MQKPADSRPDPPRCIQRSSANPSMSLKKCGTYLAMISCILQDSPTKTLTFSELMDRVRPFVSGDQKSITNSIRVCLSTNECFERIPVSADVPNCRGCWKLDLSKITAKMVRRHFKGVLNHFPELASKLETESAVRWSKHDTTVPFPQPSSCKSVRTGCETKFSGPFSIESILGGSSSPSAPPAFLASSPPSDAPGLPTTQRPTETRRCGSDAPSVGVPVYTPEVNTGGCADGEKRPYKRTRLEPPRVIYTSPGVPLCYTGPQSSYVGWPLPKEAHGGRHFGF